MITLQTNIEHPDTVLSYEWLHEWGWHKIPRQERQPTDHVRRCVGLEISDDRLFMAASEDLCIDLAPDFNGEFWYCWITKATGHNNPPHTWIHARHLKIRGDLILLYEGLTGRSFGPSKWDRRELSPVIQIAMEVPA